MFTDNAELHPKTFLNGNLMDVFEQNEQVSSPQLQFSKEELWGTAKAHHCSLPKSHHAVLSSASHYGRKAPAVTEDGCLLSWCCTTPAILAVCEFPTIQERKIVFFFSTLADERVFVPGYHWRLDHGFGREKPL